MKKDTVVLRKCTVTDVQSVKLARKAVELELEKRKALGLPIAVYDGKIPGFKRWSRCPSSSVCLNR